MATTHADENKQVLHGVSLLTDHDIYLFRQGRHFQLYEKLGAHVMKVKNVAGVHFAVWAPNARAVSVVGDFNGWRPDVHPLQARPDECGIWEGFVPGVAVGAHYKYHLTSQNEKYRVEKADPFAVRTEVPPRTASVV
ncbi:MAG: hypothetical protein NUV34_11390, partial [Sulfuricaulis sp.]|nr:hypothetical protein [Sulfuricaulis sp.]